MNFEKVMIFIDGSYLYKRLEQLKYLGKIDYQKLLSMLVGSRKLIRPYYFGSEPEHPYPLQTDFYRSLEFIGYTVALLKLRETPIPQKDGSFITKRQEKGVDMALAMEMLSLAYKKAMDTAILLAGDEDFWKLVERVQGEGIRVELAYFKESISDKLLRQVDAYICLSEQIDNILK